MTKARPGDKVSVQIRSYANNTTPARGTIQSVLGRTGRYATEMAAIIRRYQLHDAFESSALVEAAQAKAAFEAGAIEGREDLRDQLIVTIDPPEAQDFDDAISLTRNSKGHWVLGVHIADVSAFVPADSALDRSARLRGNSVYLPGQTLPMLPEILSNGICSLQPDVPRYTKTVFLTYNKDGQVMATRFCRSVIQSKARLTYQQVDRILKGEPLNQTRDIIDLLRDMEALARCLQTRRHQAGMLHLAMPEIEVILDHEGRAVDVVPKDTSFPHTLIEMFMVEANVAVARLLDRYCIPFMRRIHPAPNLATLRQLSHTLRLLGVNLSRQPKRVQLQGLLEQLGDTRLTVPVNLLVLRSLAKAVYSPAAVGHYALAASQYCHFTSPIRRYADLIVHRVLDAYLAGQVYKARRLYSIGDLTQIGAHISETEQAAEEAEQEVKTILVLSLLKRCIGEEHEGGGRQPDTFRGLCVSPGVRRPRPSPDRVTRCRSMAIRRTSPMPGRSPQPHGPTPGSTHARAYHRSPPCSRTHGPGPGPSRGQEKDTRHPPQYPTLQTQEETLYKGTEEKVISPQRGSLTFTACHLFLGMVFSVFYNFFTRALIDLYLRLVAGCSVIWINVIVYHKLDPLVFVIDPCVDPFEVLVPLRFKGAPLTREGLVGIEDVVLSLMPVM